MLLTLEALFSPVIIRSPRRATVKSRAVSNILFVFYSGEIVGRIVCPYLAE